MCDSISKIKWAIETKKINDLKPVKYNPRKMIKIQEDQLEQSLTKFGIAEPIIINTNNKVIGGHQRLKILKKKGVKNISVSVPERELTLEKEKELNLRLNKNLGEWDFEALNDNFDIDELEVAGFTAAELKIDFNSDIDEKEEKNISNVLQVLVECDSEEMQAIVYDLLKENGFSARIISL